MFEINTIVISKPQMIFLSVFPDMSMSIRYIYELKSVQIRIIHFGNAVLKLSTFFSYGLSLSFIQYQLHERIQS